LVYQETVQKTPPGKSLVNRADTTSGLLPVRPGVNAGPSTAFGGKPDESGSVLQLHDSTQVRHLRLDERHGQVKDRESDAC
jgi:hypothetical protein